MFFFSSDVVVVIPLEKRKKGGRFLTRDQKHDDCVAACYSYFFQPFSSIIIKETFSFQERVKS